MKENISINAPIEQKLAACDILLDYYQSGDLYG